MTTAEDGLVRYGWNERVARLFDEQATDGQLPGRVLVEHRGGYVVAGPDGELDASVSGRLRHEAAQMEDFPAVGDWIVFSAGTDAGGAVIHAVLPRASRFARPARGDIPGAQVVAANVDVVLIVGALDQDFNLRRLERYIALAWSSGAEPVIVLNKADVADDPAGRVADVAMIAPGVAVRPVSALEHTGFDALLPLLEPGRTVALLGSSGVGKSTITNAILGWERQRTGAVRDSDQRGRHTTTMRELIVAPSGALLIDSPGMRSVGMWDAEEGLADAFSDVESFAAGCRFADCAHESEPGCAVRAAIADGRLAASRLDSQRKLTREAAVQARKYDAALRANERDRWKRITKSNRRRTQLKYGRSAG